MRKIHLLPNLLTLANSFCGLLAICKGIDALAPSPLDPGHFYHHMETACWLVFLGMIFDAVDGKVARMVGGASAFGAQLDSFSDMLTFGVAPALLAKILIEHEGLVYEQSVPARLTFVLAMLFSVMAILRLARFNLENDPDPEAHREFKGLPSPAAAGAVSATLLMYLSLRYPDPEMRFFPDLHASPSLVWFLPAIGLMLPLLGLLMVSRVRNVHMTSYLTGRGQFWTLVGIVLAAVCLWIVPVPALFLVFNGYVIFGLARAVLGRKPPSAEVDPA